ncbi:MAG TPA: NF038122 family metalloprotease [Chthoniobacterales bacterium]
MRTSVLRGIAGALLVFCGCARALTIVPTYDSSITSLSNAAQIESAFAYAASQFENDFSNPITLNIDVTAVAGTSILGQSSFSLVPSSYRQVRVALSNHVSSADDQSAVNSLPSTNPTNGGTFSMTSSEEKALGLFSPNNPSSDGTFTFGLGFNYTFDPNHRAISGEYDFIGIAEHEISELMGRVYGLNQNGGGYVPLDLFRYTGTGVRSFSISATGVYFSINGGTTDLKAFNSDPSGDFQDWAGGATADAFDAFASPGEMAVLSSTDLRTLDIIGYTPVTAVPEPPGAILLLVGLGVGSLRYARKLWRASRHGS